MKNILSLLTIIGIYRYLVLYQKITEPQIQNIFNSTNIRKHNSLDSCHVSIWRLFQKRDNKHCIK